MTDKTKRKNLEQKARDGMDKLLQGIDDMIKAGKKWRKENPSADFSKYQLERYFPLCEQTDDKNLLALIEAMSKPVGSDYTLMMYHSAMRVIFDRDNKLSPYSLEKVKGYSPEKA